MPGSSSWMASAPQGVKGFDDNDDDDMHIKFRTAKYKQYILNIMIKCL